MAWWYDDDTLTTGGYGYRPGASEVTGQKKVSVPLYLGPVAGFDPDSEDARYFGDAHTEQLAARPLPNHRVAASVAVLFDNGGLNPQQDGTVIEYEVENFGWVRVGCYGYEWSGQVKDSGRAVNHGSPLG